MKPALLLAVLVLPLSARAAGKPLRLSGGPKSEDALRRFMTSDKRLKAKLDDAAAREEAFLAESRDNDLRDAVSDVPAPDRLKRQIEDLPGMKAPPAGACATLADCATPELAMDVPDAELLPDALRRMVRPWMLLQQSRGSEVAIEPAPEGGDAALVVTLRDLDAPRLTLNVSPRLLGGFKVWFDQPLVLASLYGRERDAALKPRR